jgi:hypothetical protein
MSTTVGNECAMSGQRVRDSRAIDRTMSGHLLLLHLKLWLSVNI